jgi:flagellar basal body-associated protein FliL
MPERKNEQTQAQTSKQGNMWWIPLVVGFLMMVIPGGMYVAPVMFIIAIIMKMYKPKKSPETPPLIITPN